MRLRFCLFLSAIFAAEALADTPEGPPINTTITSVEEQRANQTRPAYPQPDPVTEAEAAPATALPLTPRKGETIVFVGNSLAERMEHFGYFEMLLHTQFPDAEITFRNMGFPGHTPSFRPEAGQPDPWAFPGAKEFRKEINAHYGKGHYPKPDEWLRLINASTIVAFFGFNESYDGFDGVANFKAELAAFIDHTLTRSYDGSGKAPRLALATPIAMSQHPSFALPDAVERNAILSAYSTAMIEVAMDKKVDIIDLFTPTAEWFATPEDKLTINGVHLSGDGYQKLAPILVDSLFGKKADDSKASELLRNAIYDKSWFWRNDYRMLNGVHAYGQRWAPYGNFNYPEEIEKIRQMTVLRDQNIWAIAQGRSDSLKVDDSVTRPLTPVLTNYKPSEKNGTPDFLMEKEALAKFTLPEGYEVSVFATEQEFPNLGNPCQIGFDSKGRLWVSTVPSYPHYKPGGPMPNDKLLIYEDTDGDGRADKETVFAENLHIPIGFEVTPEGVYISEEPYLTLHKDMDGDDRADTKEYLLDGFDPHDTHHAISAFDVDNGGGIFMCEGRFLHSQVETPWGPQRMTDGGAWRFDPHSWKVERVFQRDVNNPWGIAHDEYGQSFLNDASGGDQFWMLGYSMKIPHAAEMPNVGKFNYEHHIRPTSGSEFLHSSHFPDDVQGDYLYTNSIGFLGIKQYKTIEDGGEIKGEHRQDLIVSSDGNCRPCDLEVGPDGSLYFVDWHNTLIGHMQHNARDPFRNSKYGRIYRITYPSRPLVKPPVIADAGIEQLFENMKLPEVNARKRSHLELRGRDVAVVLKAARSFAAANASDERLVLESLWATWGHQQPDLKLLGKCLAASDHRVRSAAVRIVRHCLHLLDQPEQYLLAAAADERPRVRLEALSGGSWLGGKEGARIFLTVASKGKENDKWIRNSLNSAIALLGPDVEALFTDGSFDRAAMPEADMLIAGKLELGLSKPTSNISAAYAHLLKSDKKLMKKYNVGKKIFLKDGSCVTCHQANGQGLPNIYPPLVGSEWATGDKERMIKLVLHGIWGKIDVNGKVFDPSKGVPPMTALGAMHDDAEIAAVMTYARASWGNAAPEITADEVKAVRAATKGRVGFYTPEELLNDHPMSKPDKSAVYFSPKAISSSDTVATYESRLENVIDSSGLKKPVSMLTDETVKTAAHRRGWVSSLQFSNAPQGKSGGQKRATFDLEIVNPLDGDATISHLILWNYTQSNLSNRALGNYRLYVDTGSGFGEKPAQSGVFLAAKEEHTPHLVPLSELKLSKGQSVKLRIRARSQGGDSVGIDEIAFRAIPAQ